MPDDANTPQSADASASSLEALEFPRVVAHCLGHARTPYGREAIAALRPLTDPERVRAELATVTEMRALGEQHLAPPLPPVTDLRPLLAAAERQGVLEPAELAVILENLEAFAALRQVPREWEEAGEATPAPRVTALVERVPEFETLRTGLTAALDERGELREDASPELRRLTGQARKLRGTIRHQLRAILEQGEAGTFTEPEFTLRDHRYVLPVVREARSQVPGILHDISASGKSVYIEPEAVVGLNNALREAEIEREREVVRLLRELTAACLREEDRLRAACAAVGALDSLRARAELAEALAAVAPEIVAVGEGPAILELPAARHPLLVFSPAPDGSPVVPNDVHLTAGTGLVLTGPNGGGKTVVLKTAGLCVLMARAGMHVPAASGARVPLFTPVLATVGDVQDLAAGLSTFAGRLADLHRFLAAAGDRALVLLDEILDGTDPGEGAALAQAILEDLVDRGATVVVTTHYPRLKLLGTGDPRFRTGAVETGFTYRLHLDAVGASSPLAMARRLSLPARIIQRTEQLRAPEDREIDRLFQALAEKVAAREQLRAEAEQERAEAARERERLAQERRALEGKVQDLLTGEQRDLLARITAGRERVRALLQRVERPEPAPVPELERARRELREEEKAAQTLRETLRRRPDPPPLAVGMAVTVTGVPGTGTVTALDRSRDRATVAVGALRLELPLSALAPGAPPPPRTRSRPAGRSSVPRSAAPAHIPHTRQTEGNSIMVRGRPVDEALDAVQAFLDRALRAGTSPVVLIHGHGTNKLKGAIREYLTTSAYVAGFRPGETGEGGDGVTVALLRE